MEQGQGIISETKDKAARAKIDRMFGNTRELLTKYIDTSMADKLTRELRTGSFMKIVSLAPEVL